jgi:hypothetical protein
LHCACAGWRRWKPVHLLHRVELARVLMQVMLASSIVIFPSGSIDGW